MPGRISIYLFIHGVICIHNRLLGDEKYSVVNRQKLFTQKLAGVLPGVLYRDYYPQKDRVVLRHPHDPKIKFGNDLP
jgi:hypothetical protein